VELLDDLMDFSSFWTVWFWITHVIAWSMASHFTLGVPFDMVQEADRESGEDGPWVQATEAMIQAQVFRFASYSSRFGTLMAGVSAFLLTVCFSLGILSDVEMARAALTFFIPLTLMYCLGVRFARKVEAQGLTGADLRKRYRLLRLLNQLVGLLAIFMAVALAIYQAVLDVYVWG